MIFQILKIMFIIDLISLLGLVIILHKEIIETIKEQKALKKKNKEEEQLLRSKMKLNQFGGWNYDD